MRCLSIVDFSNFSNRLNLDQVLCVILSVYSSVLQLTDPHCTQLACCCGSAACSLCCSACPSCRNSTSSRIMYAVMLLAVTVLSCVLLAPGLQDQLQKVSLSL